MTYSIYRARQGRGSSNGKLVATVNVHGLIAPMIEWLNSRGTGYVYWAEPNGGIDE